jgi:hypothetical protein
MGPNNDDHRTREVPVVPRTNPPAELSISDR